jgi:hypothetical protein
MVFLSIALFTVFTGKRVKTAASVGVNSEFSCVCMAHRNPSPAREYIISFENASRIWIRRIGDLGGSLQARWRFRPACSADLPSQETGDPATEIRKVREIPPIFMPMASSHLTD